LRLDEFKQAGSPYETVDESDEVEFDDSENDRTDSAAITDEDEDVLQEGDDFLFLLLHLFELFRSLTVLDDTLVANSITSPLDWLISSTVMLLGLFDKGSTSSASLDVTVGDDNEFGFEFLVAGELLVDEFEDEEDEEVEEEEDEEHNKVVVLFSVIVSLAVLLFNSTTFWPTLIIWEL